MVKTGLMRDWIVMGGDVQKIILKKKQRSTEDVFHNLCLPIIDLFNDSN